MPDATYEALLQETRQWIERQAAEFDMIERMHPFLEVDIFAKPTGGDLEVPGAA